MAKLHVFRAPKNSHVADVARLPFGQFVYSTRTNVLLSDKHHVRCEGCDVSCNLRSVYLEAIVMLARDTLNFALLIQEARVNSCASRVRI